MSSSTDFQISLEAARVYEERFVPALFAEWAPLLVDAAGVRAGGRVLDVACGTGVVARTAADRVGTDGAVVGVDLNPGMLEVARELRPDLDWREGDASALPFEDASFDFVLCQAAMMFFPDPAAALREMARVATPDGTIGVQVWGRLESSPGYLPFVEVAARHAGPDAIGLLSTYFLHGDLRAFRALVASAGLEVTSTDTRLGAIRLGSIDEFVAVEVESTPLAERISTEVYDRIKAGARESLARFTDESGAVALPIEGHLVTARRS